MNIILYHALSGEAPPPPPTPWRSLMGVGLSWALMLYNLLWKAGSEALVE